MVNSGYVEPKKKGGCLKTGLIVLGVFIVIGIVVALFGGDKNNKAKKVNTENTGTETTKKADKKAPAKDTFNVGEVAEYKDVQIGVIGYEESAGSEFVTPAEGKQFVFLNIEISNNSADDINVSSIMSFECYEGDYKLEFSSNALMGLDGKKQLDGTVAAGKKLNGYLGVEVPTGWTALEVHYVDNVWTGSKIKFAINK